MAADTRETRGVPILESLEALDPEKWTVTVGEAPARPGHYFASRERPRRR